MLQKLEELKVKQEELYAKLVNAQLEKDDNENKLLYHKIQVKD